MFKTINKKNKTKEKREKYLIITFSHCRIHELCIDHLIFGSLSIQNSFDYSFHFRFYANQQLLLNPVRRVVQHIAIKMQTRIMCGVPHMVKWLPPQSR